MAMSDDDDRQRTVARLRLVALERHHEQERFIAELKRAEEVGLSHQEIGEIVGLSRGRVTQILLEHYGPRRQRSR